METINYECYVSLEIAKLLKEAGFDWETFGYYNKLGFFHRAVPQHDELKAPTLDVAQRWLREVANMSVHVFMSPYQSEDPFKWAFSIIYDVEPDRYTSYEEALEAGIKKTLKMVLEKRE